MQYTFANGYAFKQTCCLQFDCAFVYYLCCTIWVEVLFNLNLSIIIERCRASEPYRIAVLDNHPG